MILEEGFLTVFLDKDIIDNQGSQWLRGMT
jgi:hypothetical protein